MLPLLGTKPHWMQLSEIEFMIHRGCHENWGLPLACHPLAEHMIFATPEALTERHPEHFRSRFYGPRRPANNNSIVVPYLGHVHRVSTQNWDKVLADGAVASDKKLLATMSFGSMRKVHLRMNITEQCNASPEECWYMHYSDFHTVIESYQKAWFCVQPHGDTPTRSALADCIAAGLALPCVFDDYMFDMMPFADVVNYRDFMAYVPADEVMLPGASVLDYLRAFSSDTRASMLAHLQRVSHVFQYAVQPNHLLVRWDSVSAIHARDDAFTMSLKAVLRHVCKQGHQFCRVARAGHGSGHRSAGNDGPLGS